METTKLPLHGPGLYYFALTGSRDQPIFQSVFEYDYATRILGHIEGTTLLAWVFTDHEIHCVLDCRRDWPHVLDDIRDAFAEQHERLWHKARQVISEQGTVLLIDEQAHLVDLIIQLHSLPVARRQVADASLYPWSSDHYYRTPTPPAWTDTGRMLNLLCQTRHNRAQRYEATMEQYDIPQLDLQQGNHPTYLALARDEFVTQHLRNTAIAASRRSTEELQRLRDDAIGLVADRFSLSRDDMLDRNNRRQYLRLMPLVIMLLHERGLCDEAIAELIGEDDSLIPLWLRGVEGDHSPALLKKLRQLWSPELPSMTQTQTTEASAANETDSDPGEALDAENGLSSGALAQGE
ncbi:hypothetical protein [uncultured Thalassolituus sp.]|uniref:hypothetical protein n=1 Tax=uncultured Thalassolituus sp. TaxID=285273 RepID=UPI0026150432|nr:hypothetical protein [uncultured Thalassolituus sp.]